MEPLKISRGDAECILALYDMIHIADRHFRSCQNAAYRSFLTAGADAPRTADAFGRLREAFEHTGEEA